MERREFLKVAFGFAVGAAAISATLSDAARAAPMMPPGDLPPAPNDLKPEPAVADQRDLDDAKIEEVRWGRRRGWGRRRRWGFRRRRFFGYRRRRFYGFRRRRRWGFRRRRYYW